MVQDPITVVCDSFKLTDIFETSDTTSGRFVYSATVNGNLIEADTLAEMRKLICYQLKKQFQRN